MIKNIFNNRKGGISVIITSSIVLFLSTLFFVNVIESICHLNTRNTIRNLVQVQTEIISENKTLTGNMYDYLDKDISAYKPIIKEYSIYYTIYEVSNGSINKVSQLTGNSGLNIPLSSGQIIEVTVKQTTISNLQKLTNLLSTSNNISAIEVSEKRLVK